MPKLSEIKTELSIIETLFVICGTLEEVAATKIVSLKEQFEQNSIFFEEISQLYHSVKLSASIQQMRIANKTIVKPKTVHAALTSNQHFYGQLNLDIMNRFYEETKKSPSAKVVIGKTGKDFLLARNPAFPFESIIFERDSPTEKEMHAFLLRFRNYDRIIIYYPKFMSLLSQTVDIVDITHSPSETFLPPTKTNIRYIYEPELPKIIEFFETEVRFLLFGRCLLETELSQTASRLVAMNAASTKAKELADRERKQINRLQKETINAEIVEMFGRVAAWKKSK